MQEEKRIKQITRIQKKERKRANTVINKYKTFSEVIIYKKDFDYFTCQNLGMDEDGCIISDIVDRSRKFIKDENNMLKPIDNSIIIDDLQNSITESCRRAKDNFFGYALANDWKYFITLIVNSNEYGTDDDFIINDLWHKFRKQLYYRNPDVKIIATPERHTHTETKKLHFHILVGNMDLTPYLKEARNPHTNKLLKTSFGHQLYNLDLWTFGYSSAVIIDEDKENQLKVVNYLLKYISKNSNIGYNRKKYYRTRNLDFKQKQIVLLTDTQKETLINDITAVQHKDNDRLTVYRLYDVPSDNDNDEVLIIKKVPDKKIRHIKKQPAIKNSPLIQPKAIKNCKQVSENIDERIKNA